MEINLDNQILLAQGESLSAEETSGETIPLPESSDLNQAADVRQADFITKKEFAAFKTETKQQIEDSTTLFGIANTGTVLAGSIVVELLLIVVLFLIFRDGQARSSKLLNKQKEKISDLTEKIGQLERKVEQLKNSASAAGRTVPPVAPTIGSPLAQPTIGSQSVNGSQSAPSAFSAEVSRFNVSPRQNERISEPRPIERVTEPRPINPEDKYREFVKDFNTLAGQTGFDLKKARNDFMQKYSVKTFTCVNFEARMNEPIPNPIFDSANVPANNDYWAYEFEPGVFAVVPNVKTYSDNHHAARAMGEVFKSNFTPGRTYNTIRVNKPAIFNGMWNLEMQGELKLS